MRKVWDRQGRGFSLAEILVGTAVFAMVVVGAYYFLNHALKSTKVAEMDQMVKREAEAVMRALMKDVAQLIEPPMIDESDPDQYSYTLPTLLRNEEEVLVVYTAAREEKGTLEITRNFKGTMSRVGMNIDEFSLSYDPDSFRIDVAVSAVGVPVGFKEIRVHRLTQCSYLKQEVLASRQRYWVSHNRTDAFESSGEITLKKGLENIADQFESNIDQIIAEGKESYKKAVGDLQKSFNELQKKSIPDLNKGLNKFYKGIRAGIFDSVKRKARGYAKTLGKKAAQTLNINELKALKNQAEQKARETKKDLNDLANAIEGKIKTIEAMGDLKTQLKKLKDKAKEKGWK